MAPVAGRGRLSRLQMLLIALVFMLAIGAAVYGALTYLSDVLVLRGRPAQVSVSPRGRWQVSVYDVERRVEGPDSWLLTVREVDGDDGRERVIWRGSEATISWADAQVLDVRETGLGQGEAVRIDVVAAASLRPWDGRGPFAGLFALLPALILLFGLPAAMLLPAYLGRTDRGP
jgi:hypothetical protein